jgi:hypothetical protein
VQLTDRISGWLKRRNTAAQQQHVFTPAARPLAIPRRPPPVSQDSVASAAEFFPALSTLRSGTQLSPDVVHRAKEHCKGGQSVANIQELYQWMLDVNPEMPFFDTRIAVGSFPAALAAFVAHCTWEPWKVHAVYAMHGEIYLSRLKTAKPMMDQKTYRDHFAGASMHRANGLIHMARCGAAAGHEHLLIPCWDAPLSLEDIATQGVADMRTACTLRSEKYGEKGCSDGAVKAYQAALRNLADALEVHQTVANNPGANTDRMVSNLRERATNLSLTDSKMLAACSAGDPLAAHEQASVARDVRLGDSAIHAIAHCREQPEPELGGNCVQCGTNAATHRGFSCRCLCLCEGCVAAAGVRVIECPVCDDFTEFVRA